jgi:glycosyltransferase involved in cell wall biosynthesis
MQQAPIVQSFNLAVIVPVYNDWSSMEILLRDLDFHLSAIENIEDLVVFLVDDGSTESPPTKIRYTLSKISDILIIRLGCNLGHQRAIAIGLSEVVSRVYFDAVLILDSDGEDSPSDVIKLFNQWLATPAAVVVARRRVRHEGPLFQFSYQLYLHFFQLLSGRRLDFGNFAFFSMDAAIRLVHMPELWNHFAASVLKSKIMLVGIPTDKAKRLQGQSKMNYTSLVNHGLSAASVLIDLVFARLLIMTAASAMFLVIASFSVLYQKLFTTYAIPGWASSMIALTLLGLIQLFALFFVVIFLILSSRSNFQRPTLYQAREYIQTIVSVESIS